MQLTKKISSAFAEIKRLELISLHRNPDVLAWNIDQKQSFLCSGRAHGSIVEVQQAERPRSHPLPINSLNTIENTGALKHKLRHLDITPVNLRAIACQGVRQNHALNNIHSPGARKDTSCSVSIAAPKLIMDFTIKKTRNRDAQCWSLRFASLRSLNASVSMIGRLSCRVTHHTSKEASTHAISPTL